MTKDVRKKAVDKKALAEKNAFLDELIASLPEKNMESVQGLFKDLQKKILERMLNGELDYHLGYDKHARSVDENKRNGTSPKRVELDNGPIDLAIPRDRDASFEPLIIKKGQRRLPGFEQKVIALYARGLSMRDISAHLEEIYGCDVSHDLISTITDEIMDEVQTWQQRPLDAVYPIVFMDALVVKVKENGHIRNKSLYIAIGINAQGHREILGLWLAQNEGAKFWMQVMTEMRNRGVNDIFIACVDGLKGFPEAINSIFPTTQIQSCIVHMIRNSLKFVSWQDRKTVAADLKDIYTSPNVTAAETALIEFEKKWNSQYPTIAKSWYSNWDKIIPFLAYPKEIRKIIYTTNIIEASNRQIRKVIKTKGAFPNDEAVYKIVYLALRNCKKLMTTAPHGWLQALNHLAVLFSDRLPVNV